MASWRLDLPGKSMASNLVNGWKMPGRSCFKWVMFFRFYDSMLRALLVGSAPRKINNMSPWKSMIGKRISCCKIVPFEGDMLLSGVSIYHNHNLSLPKIPSNFPELQDSSGIGTLEPACVFQAPVVRESLLYSFQERAAVMKGWNPFNKNLCTNHGSMLKF